MKKMSDTFEVASRASMRRASLIASSGYNLAEFSHLLAEGMKQYERWHKKNVLDACEDEGDEMLAELSWLASLNANFYYFFGGMKSLSRTLRRVSIREVVHYNPWPTSRSYYLHKDLVAAQPWVMATMQSQTDLKETDKEDFRPIDAPPPSVPEHAEIDNTITVSRLSAQPSAKFEGGKYTESNFRLIGCRMTSDENKNCTLLLLRPQSDARDQIVDLMLELGMDVSNPERIALTVQTTITKQQAQTLEIDFVAWELGRPVASAIGTSSLDGDTSIWTDQECDKLDAYRAMLYDDLAKTFIRASMLPSYFDLQIEEVVTGREARLTQPDAERQKSRPVGRGKPYHIVRAIKKVRAEDWTSRPLPKAGSTAPEGRTMRREPETQVEVDGFWRRLLPTSIGKTSDGKPIMGRTWVESHRRWQNKPEPEDRPRLKEPLSEHLKRSSDQTH